MLTCDNSCHYAVRALGLGSDSRGQSGCEKASRVASFLRGDAPDVLDEPYLLMFRRNMISFAWKDNDYRHHRYDEVCSYIFLTG